jgi:hypothetical protein
VKAFYVNDASISGTAVGNIGMVNNNNIDGQTTNLQINAAVFSTVATPDYFDISSAGAITLSLPAGVSLDATVKNSYEYIVTVSDSLSTTTYPITINLIASPKPPIVAPIILTVSDAATVNTVLTPMLTATHPQGVSMIFSLVSTADFPFTCDDAGNVKLTASPLNYNTKSSYESNYVVTDANAKVSSAKVTINVIETNQYPRFIASAGSSSIVTSYDFTVEERKVSGFTVGTVFA